MGSQAGALALLEMLSIHDQRYFDLLLAVAPTIAEADTMRLLDHFAKTANMEALKAHMRPRFAN